jgi:transaldolase
MTRRAVFLDRDGVLNAITVKDGTPYPPYRVADVQILPGVAEAVAKLARLGLMRIVVTNQPDIARGTQTAAEVEAINQALARQLPLDEFRVCPHDNADDCDCRKPRPGMLVSAAKQHGIDLAGSFMIGDRSGDILAGAAAGCRTFLIERAYSKIEQCRPDYVVRDLAEAAGIIARLMEEDSASADNQNMTLKDLKVKIFADGADLAAMIEMARRPYIAGLTTNPTLMRKAGISDYRAFAKQVLAAITDKPISFEVFSDEFEDMHRQAMEIASWGKNVFVKIPVTNTRAEPADELIAKLAKAGVKVNVTAVMTAQQVQRISAALGDHAPSNISVFAGRVADTGRDPLPLLSQCLSIIGKHRHQELIWASPRELLNIFQADKLGCHIITVTSDILKKLELIGKDLGGYSLDTVKMFYDDAKAAGFSL